MSYTICHILYVCLTAVPRLDALQLLKGVTTTRWRTGTTLLPSTTAMYRCGTGVGEGALPVQYIGGTCAVWVEYRCNEGAVQVQCRGGSGTLPVEVEHRYGKHPVWEAAGASMHLAGGRGTGQSCRPLLLNSHFVPFLLLTPHSSPLFLTPTPSAPCAAARRSPCEPPHTNSCGATPPLTALCSCLTACTLHGWGTCCGQIS